MLKKIKLEISAHKFIYFILSIILIAGFFIRVYRLPQILGFYFDQGRDALVIWDLIHSHKFFLIGPTTGLAGIFFWPFYYYFFAPFFWLCSGFSFFSSVFFGLNSVISVGFFFFLGY